MHHSSLNSSVSGKTKIKIVFLGNQSVGKSSIIDKYVNDRFDQTAHPTVGIDFLAKNIVYKSKNYRLQLWDTAGQQRFKSLIPGYLRDSQCSLIIFDVSSKASLNNAQSWLQLYNQNKTGQGFTLLVGNKIDLKTQREVTEQQGKNKASELGIIYYQVSAKTGQNLQQLFSNIVEICSQKSLQGANFHLKNKKQQTNAIPEDVNQGKDEQQKDKIVLKNQNGVVKIQKRQCC